MPVSIWTNRCNNSRTGTNNAETALNTNSVTMGTFGKLFTRTVDGQIFAQPLVIADVPVPGNGPRTVVYVCTTRNRVYAYDAEDPGACIPLWQKNLGPPVPRTDYNRLLVIQYKDFTEEIGITSTPVIDIERGILYLVAKTKVNGNYFHHLHALDITTGDPALAGSPREIRATFPGTGTGSVDGQVEFDPKFQLNRPGLLLMNGTIFIAFASHGDIGDYHGWVLAYDAATLEPRGQYCTTPNSREGGIWQSGTGLAGDDDNNVYCVCGNGVSGNHNFAAGPFFGCSIMKLATDGNLRVVDWFSPFNIAHLNDRDLDLCAGPVLLPGTNLVVGSGKDENFYVVDREHMGGWNPANNAIVQTFHASRNSLSRNGDLSNIHGAPVYWDGPDGPLVFVWGEQDFLRAYRFTGNQFQSPPAAQSLMTAPTGMPGGILAVSSDGNTPGTGIVWASRPYDRDANQATVRGILHAFDASDISRELWNSEHNPQGRDSLGNFAKFCPPTVANGKVYMATFSRELVVYGLLSPPEDTLPGHWAQATIHPPETREVKGSVSVSCQVFTVLGAGHDIWGTADGFEFAYQSIAAGPFAITARLLSMQDTNSWAKAGVMIRQNLEPGSPHAMVVLTPGNGAALQYRLLQNDSSTHVPGPAVQAPYWVRLVFDAGNITGFASSSGEDGTWEQIGDSLALPVSSRWLVGLAVTSHHDPSGSELQELNMAVFNPVRFP